MGNAALDIHAVKPRPRAVTIRSEIQQRSPIEQERISDEPCVRSDALRGSAGWSDAPDVQFVGERTLHEVDELGVRRPQLKVSVETGRRSEDGRAIR
jgi:hypothetical protein